MIPRVILYLSLVLIIVTINIGVISILFHTNAVTKEEEQQQVPEQQRFNAQATKILDQINAPLNRSLPASTTSTVGTEPQNKNNWIMVNHDLYGTRNSNQTIIGRNNIDKLQVKWIFNDESGIEQSPLVVGNKVYVEDNKATVLAIDSKTGLNLWKTKIVNGGGGMHGLSYDNGVIFGDGGAIPIIVAINATNGKIIWKSELLGPSSIGYQVDSPPIVWKDYVIVGSAGGDRPPNPGEIQGNITAISRIDGHVLWNFRTTVGS
jgi:outer membrane protein assembly factor BamB